MKLLRLSIRFWWIYAALFSALLGNNQYPIILVHGFMGWGRDEMSGYKYWGGKYDYEEYLREQGYEVYTASLGPVSSNWDRAIELFYQIKGGQVDYGQNHSEIYGLIQKPVEKNYSGLYPQWDESHPIHLIGHSMGGQTARMLQYLLENIIYIDSTESSPDKSILLGSIHENWIKSITTISTPHNGSTLSDIVTKTIPFLQDFIGLAAVVGNNFYNFDLQQWGFEKEENETWPTYFRRMREHPAWETKNICAHDVSIEGARVLNTLAPANPNIYYFSFSTSNTRLDSASGYHVPNESMSMILRANARIMGRNKAYWSDGSSTDSTWYENDGIVNTISQYGPTTGLNGPDPIAKYHHEALLIPGQWYRMKTFHMDHKTLMGHGLEEKDLNSILKLLSDHCALLWSL
ncbi:MAG: esterase/lipase family protein [Fidelibacterota bacterium]